MGIHFRGAVSGGLPEHGALQRWNVDVPRCSSARKSRRVVSTVSQRRYTEAPVSARPEKKKKNGQRDGMAFEFPVPVQRIIFGTPSSFFFPGEPGLPPCLVSCSCFLEITKQDVHDAIVGWGWA